MGIPRTERLVDLLKQYPQGLSLDELCEKLQCNSKKDVTNTIQLLLKQKKAKIKRCDRGIYKLYNDQIKMEPVIQTQLIQTQHEIIIDALSENKNGCTIEELAKSLNIKSNTIPNRIFHIKRKGYNIKRIGSKYHLFKPSEKQVENNIINKSTVINHNTLIPEKYRDIFLNLSDSDKADCIDMLRKSLYYHKSALSLLDSNKEILSFISSIEGGL